MPEHFPALARLGPTIHHRRSFAPIAASYADVMSNSGVVAIAEVEDDVLPLHL